MINPISNLLKSPAEKLVGYHMYLDGSLREVANLGYQCGAKNIQQGARLDIEAYEWRLDEARCAESVPRLVS